MPESLIKFWQYLHTDPALAFWLFAIFCLGWIATRLGEAWIKSMLKSAEQAVQAKDNKNLALFTSLHAEQMEISKLMQLELSKFESILIDATASLEDGSFGNTLEVYAVDFGKHIDKFILLLDRAKVIFPEDVVKNIVNALSGIERLYYREIKGGSWLGDGFTHTTYGDYFMTHFYYCKIMIMAELHCILQDKNRSNIPNFMSKTLSGMSINFTDAKARFEKELKEY